MTKAARELILDYDLQILTLERIAYHIAALRAEETFHQKILELSDQHQKAAQQSWLDWKRAGSPMVTTEAELKAHMERAGS